MDISPMNIPLEMRQHPAWVCWDYRVRHGKMTKVPLQPNGSPASSTNSTTWHTFEACYITAFHHSGIGIVLTDGLAGIDLNHHVDERGRLSDAAQCLVERLGTYTEVTPSGHGLHCLFWGKLPAGGRRNDRYGLRIVWTTQPDISPSPVSMWRKPRLLWLITIACL